ncbi:MAG: lipoyl(octanoyl) transferase LipB [Pseudomonadota bacterium]|jgi:lipoyl(octanoyl) transferase
MGQAGLLDIQVLGRRGYRETLLEMQRFTETRDDRVRDALWLVEHPPVYTLGLATDPSHLLQTGNIDVVQTDRGGQVTYHGPGQVLAYLLLDLRRAGLHVRETVAMLEQASIDLLLRLGCPSACRKPGAPGVYVQEPHWRELSKIAAVGLRIRRGCSFHGMSLNVDMDLSPFEGIHPCGMPGLRTVDLATIGLNLSWQQAAEQLGQSIQNVLQRSIAS